MDKRNLSVSRKGEVSDKDVGNREIVRRKIAEMNNLSQGESKENQKCLIRWRTIKSDIENEGVLAKDGENFRK